MPALTTILFVATPAAPFTLRRTAPELTLMQFVTFAQPEPELSAASSRTPLSFLKMQFVTTGRLNAVLRVSILPAVTSNALFAWLSVMVRRPETVKVSVARRPPCVVELKFRRMPLLTSPNWESSVTERTPLRISTFEPMPPKLLFNAALASTSVPLPDFTRPKPAPVTWPLRVMPCTTLELVALAMLRVGVPVRVVTPVNSSP